MRRTNEGVMMRREIYASAAKKVNETVTMKDVLDFYGISRTSAGFIRCPFHRGDNAPSLKAYAHSWHCFGCNSGSSIVDFVMKYENVGFREAVERCDKNFSLGLNVGERKTFGQLINTQKENARRREEKSAADKEHDLLVKNLWEAHNHFAEIDRKIIHEKPTCIEEMTDSYAEALRQHAQARYEYQCAEYKLSDFEAKRNEERAISA